MFKRTATQAWRYRRLHSQLLQAGQVARARPARSAVIASSAAVTAGLLWYSFSTTIHNDAVITPTPGNIFQPVPKASTSSTGVTNDDRSICAVVWVSTNNLYPNSFAPQPNTLPESVTIKLLRPPAAI
ncbi:hypothetical protein AZE42_11478 [Rhizopogon vesiculosus]|uniref:Uncharacterized protein n=1 Tax=Rhizopogon vesiculosus TaxID=180088 RepID=A0A1J8Q762_9AGAM|nr:hypothetical protein AZE42_11478 [Rhizopogon vesiculosus]